MIIYIFEDNPGKAREIIESFKSVIKSDKLEATINWIGGNGKKVNEEFPNNSIEYIWSEDFEKNLNDTIYDERKNNEGATFYFFVDLALNMVDIIAVKNMEKYSRPFKAQTASKIICLINNIFSDKQDSIKIYINSTIAGIRSDNKWKGTLEIHDNELAGNIEFLSTAALTSGSKYPEAIKTIFNINTKEVRECT